MSIYYSEDNSVVLEYKFEQEPVIPLYFYSTRDVFSFGIDARKRFHGGDSDAFGNYFDLIQEPAQTYSLYGSNEFEFKKILVSAFEKIMESLLRNELYKDVSNSNIKNSIDQLILVYSSDLLDKEKRLVSNVFQTAGYNKIKAINKTYAFLTCYNQHSKLDNFKSIFTIEGYENDLWITHFEGIQESPTSLKSIPGLGADPKAKIIAEMLFYKAVDKADAPFKKEQEESEILRLMPLALKYLEQGKKEPIDTVRLSDGTEERVRIKLREVNDKVDFRSDYGKLHEIIEDNLKNSNSTLIDSLILPFGAIAGEILLEKLRQKYSHVNVCDLDTLSCLSHLNSNDKIIDQGNLLPTRATSNPPTPTASADPAAPSRPAASPRPEAPKAPKPPSLPKPPAAPKATKPPVVSKPPAAPKATKPPVVSKATKPPAAPKPPVAPKATKPPTSGAPKTPAINSKTMIGDEGPPPAPPPIPSLKSKG